MKGGSGECRLVRVPQFAARAIEEELQSGSQRLVEITLSPSADLVGKTLKEIDFRARFDLALMSIRHEGRSIVSRLSDVPLSFGDALLVQGEAERTEQLRVDANFLILDTPALKTRQLNKAPLTVAIYWRRSLSLSSAG